MPRTGRLGVARGGRGGRLEQVRGGERAEAHWSATRYGKGLGCPLRSQTSPGGNGEPRQVFEQKRDVVRWAIPVFTRAHG